MRSRSIHKIQEIQTVGMNLLGVELVLLLNPTACITGKIKQKCALTQTLWFQKNEDGHLTLKKIVKLFYFHHAGMRG